MMWAHSMEQTAGLLAPDTMYIIPELVLNAPAHVLLIEYVPPRIIPTIYNADVELAGALHQQESCIVSMFLQVGRCGMPWF